MRKTFFHIALLILFGISVCTGQSVIQKGKSFYISNTLVVKFKKDFPTSPQTLNKSTQNFSIQNLTQLFPPQSKLNKGDESLSRIYLLTYNSPEDPLEAATKISRQTGVEWAEPKYIQTVTYSPNDLLYALGRQQNLKRVFADSAWNITKGDSSVIIGIVDTGVDWTHPDLIANVWYDHGNFVGKDLGGENGTPDDDPKEDASIQNRYHGTHVAGIACATTNNQKGISSIGFNCSFIPIKASRGDKRDANDYPYIYYGYEGIKYAADKGAWVINCSWGGFDYSNLGQEIINYAISREALVVAAAGNDGELTDFYPASYQGVLSVGSSDTDSDVISFFANYGRSVDVFAPGFSILSTWPQNPPIDSLYYRISGSSMSSPLVAGLAGLVFSTRRSYTALQTAEQIRVTSDNIEQFNDASLKYLLGRGRINAFRAVTDTNATAIRATSVKFIDEGNGNGILESGEMISIEITFTNYLKSATNISVQLENTDSSVEFLNRSFVTGPMATLGTVSNSLNKFKFEIHADASLNHDLHLLLKYIIDGNEVDFQWINARINPTYDTHNIGNITMSITSKGALGFNDFPNNLEGSGFKFNGGDNLLFEGAFMFGTLSNKLMDAARVTAKQSEDFTTITPMKVINDGIEQDGRTVFSDAGAGANALGITTQLLTYTYSQPPDDNYIILKATLNNATSQDISNLYAGYYFDWDMPADTPTADSTYYDETNNFGVAFDKTKSVDTYVGAALLSSNNYGYYPIDNNATTGEVILANVDGFSDAEKWITISSKGTMNKTAGPSDISFVISAGPFSIPANKSIDIGFSVAAGSTLDELKNAISRSRDQYPKVRTDVKEGQKPLPTELSLYQNYPNPFNPSTEIKYQIPAGGFVTLKVYDLLGREVATLVNDYKQPGIYNSTFNISNYSLPSGVYFYRLSFGDNIQTKKMILLK